MHAGGYLDRTVTRTSPTRLTIVIAAHGAAIAALMLARMDYIPIIRTGPIDIYNVPIKEPPPPNALPQPERQQPTERVTLPTTIVPTGTDNGTIITQITKEDEGLIKPQPLPPIEPVLVEAAFQRGVQIQPDYPTSLARQEIEGTVTVRILIGTDGRVKDVQQVSATEPEFFTATERQARRYWRFKPATRDGVAVESWRTMTVRFKLEA